MLRVVRCLPSLSVNLSMEASPSTYTRVLHSKTMSVTKASKTKGKEVKKGRKAGLGRYAPFGERLEEFATGAIQLEVGDAEPGRFLLSTDNLVRRDGVFQKFAATVRRLDLWRVSQSANEADPGHRARRSAAEGPGELRGRGGAAGKEGGHLC